MDCIKSRKQPGSPVETAHRSGSVGLISLIAMRTGKKLSWNPVREEFLNDDEANLML
jgi:myo-inositol 2-dehydrogenase / D-chiro-inositol 1-dehydrogenase